MTKKPAPVAPAVPHTPDAILELKVGGYMVASRTTTGAWWLVFGQTCSCPATVRCHHLRLVSTYCARKDAERRPKPVPVNVSLMVD